MHCRAKLQHPCSLCICQWSPVSCLWVHITVQRAWTTEHGTMSWGRTKPHYCVTGSTSEQWAAWGSVQTMPQFCMRGKYSYTWWVSLIQCHSPLFCMTSFLTSCSHLLVLPLKCCLFGVLWTFSGSLCSLLKYASTILFCCLLIFVSIFNFLLIFIFSYSLFYDFPFSALKPHICIYPNISSDYLHVCAYASYLNTVRLAAQPTVVLSLLVEVELQSLFMPLDGGEW